MKLVQLVRLELTTNRLKVYCATIAPQLHFQYFNHFHQLVKTLISLKLFKEPRQTTLYLLAVNNFFWL